MTDSSDAWMRRGFSLLWNIHALQEVASPNEVVSLREFFALMETCPDLPSNDGQALVLVGAEGCLDALSREDSKVWLEDDIRPAYLKFQDCYQGQAALILWLPSGQRRTRFTAVERRCFWGESSLSQGHAAGIPIGQHLFGGAESDANEIIREDKPIGLHIRRLS